MTTTETETCFQFHRWRTQTLPLQKSNWTRTYFFKPYSALMRLVR